MVATQPVTADSDPRRKKATLEKAKVVNLSKQLQMRLQYARLKVEHGWQRQSLNEVENLYFHHSTLKGKSRAPVPLFARPTPISMSAASSTIVTANGSASKEQAGPRTAEVHVVPEAKRPTPPTSVVSTPPTIVSPPPTTPSPTVQTNVTPPAQAQAPIKDVQAQTAKSATAASVTFAPTPTAEVVRPISLPPSVLSAFSQNYAVAQPPSRTSTMDFSILSPFVTPSSFSSSSSSFTAPSSFVSPAATFAPQPLAYPPSPFAPPAPSTVPVPTPASIALPHFQPSYPMVMQMPNMPLPMSTFPTTTQVAFPSAVQAQVPVAPASIPTPPPASTPVPAPSQPSPITTPSIPSISSFRPTKTFDIPTAPGPGTPTGTGMQGTAPPLTYDSFWSSHSSAGGWRKALSTGSASVSGASTPATGNGGAGVSAKG
ncbi:hypothetical protein BC834DRAFT_75532 [Gloeopeniophorella convolvens]|nr:hypothetical protein BC834DRAFT_75532 [Gloeopeniophorella convolvens]